MRSDTVTKGVQQAPHRSLFNALGMTQEELDYLNEYHAKVYEALAPHVEPETLAWLKEACKPL